MHVRMFVQINNLNRVKMRGNCQVYTIENQDSKTLDATRDVSISDSNEFQDLDRGWSYVILFASFGTCCLIGANNYGTGIIHKILQERYNESVVLTSWSGSLQLALMCLAAPLSSAVIDRFSCRTSVLISGILFVSGYWLTAFAPNIYIAIFTCGVSAGIAAGFGYTASIVAVGFNFRKRKHIALGVTLSGMGAGIFAFAPIMNIAHAYYGSTGFFITMATISANIITFGTLYFPSKLEIYTRRQREKTTKAGSKATVSTLKMYYSAVIRKPVVLLSVATFAFCGGTDLIFLNLPTIVTFKGFASSQAAYLVSLNGIMSVVGRLMTGFLSQFERISKIWLYTICLGVVALATIVYPFVAFIFEGQIIFNFILGLFFGSGYVLISPMCSYFVDIHFLSAAIGFVLFFGGLGSIVGPMIAGILLDNGGTYDQCIFIAGSFVLAAALLGAVSNRYKSHKNDASDAVNPVLCRYIPTNI